MEGYDYIIPTRQRGNETGNSKVNEFREENLKMAEGGRKKIERNVSEIKKI